MRTTNLLTGVCLAAFAAAGCSNLPSRVPMPRYDASAIAARAIEAFDASGDQLLSAEELTRAPSLRSAMSRIDQNGDEQLSAGEIENRIAQWQEYRAGLSQTTCIVIRNGAPVRACKVTLQPEEFMLESVVPAYATTTGGGNAIVSVAKEHRPGPAYKGVQSGFYRVEVTLEDGTQVANLNEGAEVAGDLQNSLHIVLP